MSESAPRRRNVAAAAALLAAFVWASYYGFVLGLAGRVSPLALLVYPFLFGGIGYGGYCAVTGRGAAFLRLFASPAQWGRVVLLLGAQCSLLTVTLTGGAVDAALLALVGDVALTPLLVMLVFREGRDRLTSPRFDAGLGLSAAGASLTILAGGSVVPLQGLELLAGAAIPCFVAGYFVSSARAARRMPVDAVAGQSALAAGLLALPGSWLLPASWGSLDPGGPVGLLLLVGAGLTSFFVATALYFGAIGRVGILLPALLMAAIPVFTLAFAAGVAGQVPSTIGLWGVPLAAVGALLAVSGSTEPARSPAATGD